MKVNWDLQVNEAKRVRVVDLELEENGDLYNMHCTLEDGTMFTFYDTEITAIHENFSDVTGIEVETLKTLYRPSREPE